MVDEAHSFGVLGENGHGVREHLGLPVMRWNIWMGTLSKALGSCGGFIAGNGDLMEAIRTVAPGVEQSPVVPHRRPPEPRWQLLTCWTGSLTGLRGSGGTQDASVLHCAHAIWTSDCHRTPRSVLVLVPGELQVGFASSMLLQRGVYVGPVASPGVQPGQERLRFFVTSEHTEEQLRATAELVAEVVAVATQGGGVFTMSNVGSVIEEMTGAGRRDG